MNTEVNAAPGAAAEAPAPETIAQTAPDAATPESNEAQQPETTTEQPEQGDADKSLKRLQRRVDRVTAARYQAEAEARQLRERLEQYERQAPQQDDQLTTVRPEDVDRLANERAASIAQAREVDRRGAEITSQLLEAVGSNDAVRAVVAAVTEEAGELIDPRTGRWTALGEAIEASDNPADLLKYLSLNEDTAASLRGLSPARLGRKLASIESEMSKKSKVSKAPVPLSPVTAAGSPVAKAEASMTDAEWYAQRKATRRI